jgi:bile acid-coenzyme A ligase
MPRISIGRAIRWWSEKDGDRPALTFENTTVTRRQLEDRSNRLAREFALMGVKQGDFVALVLPNCIEFFESVIAAVKLGAAVMPVSPKTPAHERDPVLDLLNPALIVGLSSGSYRNIGCIPQGYRCQDSTSSEPLADVVAVPWFATSSGGSTGRPKVIVNSQAALFDPEVPESRLALEKAVLIPGPLDHGGPFHTAVRALLFGNHVVVMPRFDPEACMRLVDLHHIDYLPVVPTMMNRMLRLGREVVGRYDLSSLRVMVSFGAACPAWLKEGWIDLIGAEQVQEFYSCTEQLGMTWITGTEWLEHRGSVGRPVNGSQVRIFGADGKQIAAGEIGDIYLMPSGGPGSSYRYIGSESRRREDGWETCGDLGWLDQDGYLYIADRRTDLIVSGGANVYPAEVEAVLDQHPRVRASAVIGLPDDDLGHRVHAVIEAESPIDIEELKAWMAARLVRYKIPRTFEFVSEAVRNETGKVRRSALRQARMAN